MFATLAMKSSARTGPASGIISPTTHVAPLAGRELRAVLQGPEASAALDAVGCRTPALGMLRLKLARQIARDDATAQAARTGEPMRWYPSPVVMQRRRADRERAAATTTTAKDSTFANTEPSTQVRDEGHSS